jgi:hypothetical protein
VNEFDRLLRDAIQCADGDPTATPEPAGNVVPMPARSDGLIYREDAAPPFGAFERLYEADRAFKYAWDHRPPDLPFASYESTLADRAVAAGWGNQQVLDLLIAHRVKWLEDWRPDPVIITRARSAAPATPNVVPMASPPQGSDAIAIIRRGREIPVCRVRKLGGKRGVFELILEDQSIVELGTASSVQSHREVSAAVFDAIGRTIPPLKGELWRKVIDAIGTAAEVEEIGSSPEEELRSWLRAAERTTIRIVLDRSKPAELARHLRDGDHGPICFGPAGEFFVSLQPFIRYVQINFAVRPTWADVTLRLRRLGFRPERLSARDKDGVAKGRFWISPRGFTLDD